MTRTALPLPWLLEVAAELARVDGAGWVVEEKGVGHLLVRAGFDKVRPAIWVHEHEGRAHFSGSWHGGVERPWDRDRCRHARFDATVALDRPVPAIAAELHRRLVKPYLAAWEVATKDKRAKDRADAETVAALGRIAAAHPLAEVVLSEKGGLNDYRRVYLRRVDAFTVVLEADYFGRFHLGRTHCGLCVSEAVATAVLRAMAEEERDVKETTKETA